MIVLINLGTPKTYRRWSVIKYLWEFLMDPYVINLPFLARFCLITFIIAPFRSKNTAKSYQHIWFKEKNKQGSPLLYYANELKEAVQSRVDEKVFLAMRYGKPSLNKVVDKVIRLKVKKSLKSEEKIIFVPLYPHYALSTTETVTKKIETLLEKKLKKHGKTLANFNYQFVTPFYSHPLYIQSLSVSMLPYLKQKFDFVLFSYHGLPESHITNLDTDNHCLQQTGCCDKPNDKAEKYCYRYQVKHTTQEVVKRVREQGVKLPDKKFSFSFQSRLGRDPWLLPATENVIKELAGKGVKNLLIIAPSFINDNLETLFEIKIELRDIFIESGGKNLSFVPCLNANDYWVDALLKIITSHR